MAGLPIDSEAGAPSRRPAQALGIGAALALVALAAHAGRIAETPLAGRVPALAALGPGAIGMLRAITADPGNQPPAGIDRKGRAALAGAPLASEPFFSVAAAGFRGKNATGSTADAALLREAIRRNPRSREARLYLLRHAVAAGDLGEAIDQLAVLNRLTSEVTGTLMPAVGAAIVNARQADDSVVALAAHPELLAPFLRGFASISKPPELAVRLVSRLPRGSFADPAVRRLAVEELVRARAFAQARALWGQSAAKGALVHSPDFTDTRARPPFNWELWVNATGAAERQAGGGISVAYYGREPGPLARQLLTLSPGPYKARIDYRTLSGSPGAIGLQLHCAGMGSEGRVFDQPLAGTTGTLQALTVTFDIPAQDCGGQFLSIAGRVQESRDPQEVNVRSLTVERGGAR